MLAFVGIAETGFRIVALNFLALRVLTPLKDGMEEAGLHESQETFPDASDDGDAPAETNAESSDTASSETDESGK